MKQQRIIILSIVIVIANLLIGHFFAPTGLLLTPVIFIGLTILIGFTNNEINPLAKSLLLLVMIVVHDIGIKLYAGGTHDAEGRGVIHFMLFIGLIPSFLLLIFAILKQRHHSLMNKIIAIALFPIIIGLHVVLTNNVGMGRHYSYEWNK